MDGHRPPVEELVNLIPCNICSAPFDPSTFPSHFYDPYNAFSLPHHSLICPSCFAEELARRAHPSALTRGRGPSLAPAPTEDLIERHDFATPSAPSVSGGTVGTGGSSSKRESPVERNDSAAAFVDSRSGTLRRTPSSTMSRSSSARHRRTKSRETLRGNQVRSGEQLHQQQQLLQQQHSRTKSLELLRSNQSANTTPPLEPSPESQRSKSHELFRTGSVRSMSQLSSHSESKGRNVLRKKSIRRAEEKQRERYKEQQEELRRQWQQLTPVVPKQHRRSKSHDVLGMSSQRSTETLRPHARSQSINALRDRDYRTHDYRPATSSRVQQSYASYQRPPQFVTPTLGHSRQASSVRSLPLSPVSPTYSSRTAPDPFTRPLTRSSFRNFSTPLGPQPSVHEPIIELDSFPETVAQPTLRPLSSYNEKQSSWLTRRFENRASRRAEKAAHKQALANKKRKAEVQEAKQRGIGLDLFCAECQTVVRTVPAYKRGSCFMWWAAVALFCLGPIGLIPICFCLIPCTGGCQSSSSHRHAHGSTKQASMTDSGNSTLRNEKIRAPDDEGCISGSRTAKREVMDVEGCCPLCNSVLSEFCRRRGELRVFTWAGMLGEGETGVGRERSVRTVRSARGPIGATAVARRTTTEVPGGRI
jgi:hypothetical protein